MSVSFLDAGCFQHHKATLKYLTNKHAHLLNLKNSVHLLVFKKPIRLFIYWFLKNQFVGKILSKFQIGEILFQFKQQKLEKTMKSWEFITYTNFQHSLLLFLCVNIHPACLFHLAGLYWSPTPMDLEKPTNLLWFLFFRLGSARYEESTQVASEIIEKTVTNVLQRAHFETRVEFEETDECTKL